MKDELRFWILGAASLALMGLSAKAHGRQIRLERELEGYFDVDFRRRSPNPAWVEALWRKDRVQFWITYAVAAVLLLAYLSAGHLRGWTLPLEAMRGTALSTFGLPLAALALWALTTAFVINGLTSWARLGRRWTEESAKREEPWRRRAVRGSWSLWAAVALLGVAVSLGAFL